VCGGGGGEVAKLHCHLALCSKQGGNRPGPPARALAPLIIRTSARLSSRPPTQPLTGTGAPRDHAKALRYFQGASQAAGVGAWPGGGDAYFFLGAPPARVCVCLGSLWECVSFLGGHVGCVCDETC
jgi:hypothetical protein